MIVFDKLWILMKERNITQYQLIKKYHFSPAQITRLKRNHNINTYTVNRLCSILGCNVEDIMEYIEDESDIQPDTDDTEFV